jgi:hypothetical protein
MKKILLLIILFSIEAKAGTNNVVTGVYPDLSYQNKMGSAVELYTGCLTRVTNTYDINTCSAQSTLTELEKETIRNNILIAHAQQSNPQTPKKLDCSVYLNPKPGFAVDSAGYNFCVQRNNALQQ